MAPVCRLRIRLRELLEAPQSRAEPETVVEAFDVPTFANMVEGGKTPYLETVSFEEFEGLIGVEDARERERRYRGSADGSTGR
ncbi:hypothetical protein ACYJ1Y_04410 [Natrialbaceae archaeon A-gly3]